LAVAQFKGSFGITKRYNVKDRYKYDALEFYSQDIFWFSFSFTIFALSGHVYSFISKVHNGTFKWLDDEDTPITDGTYGKVEIYLVASIMVSKAIQVILYTRMRTADFLFASHTFPIWSFIFLI